MLGGAAAGGKGETFCVPTVLSCETRGRHFIFSRPVYSARKRFGGFYKKSAYCNDGLTCGNRQMHKAEGVADALLLRFSSATPGATGLTVLALILACVATLRC